MEVMDREIQTRIDFLNSGSQAPTPELKMRQLEEYINGNLTVAEYSTLASKLHSGDPLTSKEGRWVIRAMDRNQQQYEPPSLLFQVANIVKILGYLPAVLTMATNLSELDHYLGGGYADLNRALSDGSTSLELKVRKHYLNLELTPLPEYRGTVYRGSRGDLRSARKKYVPGTVITRPGFTSTSPSLVTAWDGFGGNLFLEISSLHGKRVSLLNMMESEVLFKADTRFRVLEVVEIPVLPFCEEPSLYVRLVEVED